MPTQAALAAALRGKSATDAPLAGLFDYQAAQAAGPISQIGEQERGWLDAVRKYDPNASWRLMSNAGSSNEGGGTAADTYVLDFDQSKLPNAGGSRKGASMPAFNSAGQAQGIIRTGTDAQGNNQFRGSMFDDSRQWDSPYGRVTDTRNVNDASPLWDTIFRYAPMVIGAGAGIIGAGGLAGLAGGANSWASGAANLLNSASQGNTGGAASAGLGLLGSAFGLPSWATNIGRTALSAALRNREGG